MARIAPPKPPSLTLVNDKPRAVTNGAIGKNKRLLAAAAAVFVLAAIGASMMLANSLSGTSRRLAIDLELKKSPNDYFSILHVTVRGVVQEGEKYAVVYR